MIEAATLLPNLEDHGGSPSLRKSRGAYYTPDRVAQSLVRWAVRSAVDRLLDPSCGDGQFVALHGNSVGVEQNLHACITAKERSKGSIIVNSDFFEWAGETNERFDCVVGNPPFIRYQLFSGNTRKLALSMSKRHGAMFSALTSSWAPFLVCGAALLKPGGRLAFVVPAEIGHAPYAAPVLKYMALHFEEVHVIAVRNKLFPDLSEDCWLLYASGYGGSTSTIGFSGLDSFVGSVSPPKPQQTISMDEWEAWHCRLRPLLLPKVGRDLYAAVQADPSTRRLRDFARVGIGYVTGANDFFHLRPSQARTMGIPCSLVHPTVRNGRALAGGAVNVDTVNSWLEQDEPCLLLKLDDSAKQLPPVRKYLDSEAGTIARESYKCRNRKPWFQVPDVFVPDGFLAYMSGDKPVLVVNEADCVCSNSILAIRVNNGSIGTLAEQWKRPFTALSCEIEGHPLGGGMHKLEPREAGRVIVDAGSEHLVQHSHLIEESIRTLKRWRHLDV